MPNERASELAKQIFEDLRGAAYYADPEVLASLLNVPKHQALEILRELLRDCANRSDTDKDVKRLASTLEAHIPS